MGLGDLTGKSAGLSMVLRSGMGESRDLTNKLVMIGVFDKDGALCNMISTNHGDLNNHWIGSSEI